MLHEKTEEQVWVLAKIQDTFVANVSVMHVGPQRFLVWGSPRYGLRPRKSSGS